LALKIARNHAHTITIENIGPEWVLVFAAPTLINLATEGVQGKLNVVLSDENVWKCRE